MPRLVQTDATTEAALAAAVSRLGWCEALSAALGDAYRVVWRTSGGDAVVTCVMTGSLPVSEQTCRVSAQPASVTCASGTPTQTLLESADGTRWARLDRMVPLVDSQGAALAPVAGAGFTWVQPLVVMPPAGLSRLPAWLQDAGVLQRVSIPNTLMTSTGSGTGITSYSGATMRGTQMLVFGGGHSDYYGNEVIGIDYAADAPAWSTVGAGSPVELQENAVLYYADGKPSSRHTYWHLHWVEQHNRMFALGGTTAFSSTYVTSMHADAFNPDTGEWDEGGGASWPDVLTGNSAKGSVLTPSHIWEFSGSTGRLYRCDLPTMAWTDCGGLPDSHSPSTPVFYDPARNRLVRPRGGPDNRRPRYWSLDGYTSGMPASTVFSFTGAVPDTWASYTFVYCDYLAWLGKDAYLACQFQDSLMRVWAVDPDTWEVHLLPLTGTQPAWPSAGGARQNYYGRFAYVPELRGVAWAYSAAHDVQFLRTN